VKFRHNSRLLWPSKTVPFVGQIDKLNVLLGIQTCLFWSLWPLVLAQTLTNSCISLSFAGKIYMQQNLSTFGEKKFEVFISFYLLIMMSFAAYLFGQVLLEDFF